MRSPGSTFVILVLLCTVVSAPFFAFQPGVPVHALTQGAAPPPLTGEATASPAASPVVSDTDSVDAVMPGDTASVGDYEIQLIERDVAEPSSTGGVDVTLDFSLTYNGPKSDIPEKSLAFSARGNSGIVYDLNTYGCGGPEGLGERLFTGGTTEGQICFTVHPDDVDVLAVGISTAPDSGALTWFATTDQLPDLSTGNITLVDITTADTFRFAPAEITIPADTDVTIRITNSGFLQHDVLIDETDYQSELVANGQTTELIVNLSPGTYTFRCTVAGHKEGGEVGTIHVVD